MTASNPPRYRPPLTRKRPPAMGQSKSARYSACPYLGTEADPGTSLSYPTDANHCYRTRLPVPISGIHQESYCITDRYQGCPVYRQNLHLDDVAIASVPVTFYNEAMQPEAVADVVAPAPVEERASNLRSVLLAALILALLLGSWWVWRSFLAQPDPNLALNTLQIEPTIAIAEQPPGGESAATTDDGDPGSAPAIIVGADSEPTATALPPTPVPTEDTGVADDAGIDLPELPPTATPVPSTEAEATVCERTPVWWTPYVVQSGDTLDSLAEQLGLERDLIIESNCLDAMVIVPGLTISLPPLGTVVEITPTAEPSVTVTATTAATSGPIAGIPTVTATPIVLPTVTPAATATVDQPDDLATPPSQPTRRPTAVPTTTIIPTATAPVLPTPGGPTATPPVFPGGGTQTATPPVLPGGGSPTATPPALP